MRAKESWTKGTLELKQTQDRKGTGPACPVESASLFFHCRCKFPAPWILPLSCVQEAFAECPSMCQTQKRNWSSRAVLLVDGVISAVMGSMQCSMRVLAWLGCCTGTITSHLLWLCCYEFKACLSITPHIIQMAFIPSHGRTRKGNTQNSTAREWLPNRERKGKRKNNVIPKPSTNCPWWAVSTEASHCHDCPYSLLGKGRNYVGISTDRSCPKMPHSR